jgi:hypothetical protein
LTVITWSKKSEEFVITRLGRVIQGGLLRECGELESRGKPSTRRPGLPAFAGDDGK